MKHTRTAIVLVLICVQLFLLIVRQIQAFLDINWFSVLVHFVLILTNICFLLNQKTNRNIDLTEVTFILIHLFVYIPFNVLILFACHQNSSQFTDDDYNNENNHSLSSLFNDLVTSQTKICSNSYLWTKAMKKLFDINYGTRSPNTLNLTEKANIVYERDYCDGEQHLHVINGQHICSSYSPISVLAESVHTLIEIILSVLLVIMVTNVVRVAQQRLRRLRDRQRCGPTTPPLPPYTISFRHTAASLHSSPPASPPLPAPPPLPPLNARASARRKSRRKRSETHSTDTSRRSRKRHSSANMTNVATNSHNSDQTPKFWSDSRDYLMFDDEYLMGSSGVCNPLYLTSNY